MICPRGKIAIFTESEQFVPKYTIYYPRNSSPGGTPAEEYSKIKKMSGQMNRTKNILVGCMILVLFPRDGFVSIFKK